MKQITKLAALMIITIAGLSTCAKAQKRAPEMLQPALNHNILIVYLSRTKNTKAVAEMIQADVGGDLVSIELKNPYPENYKEIVEQVSKENESGFLPPLRTKIDSIEKYDVLFLGFPTWGMQLPPPVKSFLHDYNLKGITVIPFNTNAGYGAGSSFETVKTLCPQSRILEGISIKGGVERDGVLFVMEGKKEEETKDLIKRWLKKIYLTN